MAYLYKDLDLGFLRYKECVGGTYIPEHYRCKNCPYRYRQECIISSPEYGPIKVKAITLKKKNLSI